jgi:hypothetical protein
MTHFHVRRDKAALFQWVQGPPGDRSSRKRPWCVLSFEAVALLRNKGATLAELARSYHVGKNTMSRQQLQYPVLVSTVR